jgi:hypothetical protein
VPAHYRTTLEAQAHFLIETFGAARGAGFERIAWYQLRDGSDPYDTYALVRRNGTRRPAFDAFRFAKATLSLPGEAIYRQIDDEGNEYLIDGIWPVAEGRLVRIRQPERQVLVAWSMKPRGLDVTLEIPPGGSVVVTDWQGNPVEHSIVEHGVRVSLPPAQPPVPNDAVGYHRFGGAPVIISVQY